MYAPPHSRPSVDIVSDRALFSSNEIPAHTLKFDLVLDDQIFALGINWLCKLRRDGVVSSLVLDYEAFVAFHAFEDGWLLDGPGADILPFLFRRFVSLLLRVRCLPPRVPVVCKLLEEGGFEGCGLLDVRDDGRLREG